MIDVASLVYAISFSSGVITLSIKGISPYNLTRLKYAYALVNFASASNLDASFPAADKFSKTTLDLYIIL